MIPGIVAGSPPAAGLPGNANVIFPAWNPSQWTDEYYIHALSPNGRYVLGVCRDLDYSNVFLTLDLQAGSVIGPNPTLPLENVANTSVDLVQSVFRELSIDNDGNIYAADGSPQTSLWQVPDFGAGAPPPVFASAAYMGYLTWTFTLSNGDRIVVVFDATWQYRAAPSFTQQSRPCYVHNLTAGTVSISHSGDTGHTFIPQHPFCDAYDDIWMLGAKSQSGTAYLWRVYSSGNRPGIADLQIIPGLAATPGPYSTRTFMGTHLGGAGNYLISWNSNEALYLVDEASFAVVASRTTDIGLGGTSLHWANVPPDRSDLWLPDAPLLFGSLPCGWSRVSGSDLSILENVSPNDWGLAIEDQWWWPPTNYALFSYPQNKAVAHWEGANRWGGDYRPIILRFD